MADMIQSTALAFGPGTGAASGWLALLGFSLTSTIASQGYRSLATLNMVPWRSVAPVKALGVATAAVVNILLFGKSLQIHQDKSFLARIPRSMSLIMQAPFLALMSITELDKAGRTTTLLAGVTMMMLVPTAMTLVDIAMSFKKPQFKEQKLKFATLSLTANTASVATAYLMMYGAFGLRNGIHSLIKAK